MVSIGSENGSGDGKWKEGKRANGGDAPCQLPFGTLTGVHQQDPIAPKIHSDAAHVALLRWGPTGRPEPGYREPRGCSPE
mmetsp:Transcript_11254/g.31930  ORF Transcript_11254/g.31930 Transcript_11254/m.31930 type:complete len:80 (+) Transcript_11254:247-486(+)